MDRGAPASAPESAPANRRMHWLLGGLLLGAVNTFAVATYASLGVSRNYVVTDSLLLRLAGSGFWSTNSYLSQYPAGADWLLMLAPGMIAGGFLAALARRSLHARAVPDLWRSRFGDSRARRFAAAFTGGFLLLLGARIAGGCTSGLVLSGTAMLAAAGFVFSVTILISGIVTARLLYRRAS